MIDLSEVEVVADPLDHPEGVAVAGDGTVYAGGEAGQLYRLDGLGGVSIVAETGGWLLGLAVAGDGAVIACDCERRQVVRIVPASGEVSEWCGSASGTPLVLPNVPLVLADGSVLVSDSGTESETAEGRILLVPPGGGDAAILDVEPLEYANGLAVAADGSILVAETHASRVSELRAGRRSTYHELPGTMPDGLALDAEGGLIVACFQPNVIVRIPRGGGSAAVLVEDWSGRRLLSPTNVAFSGVDRRTLLIASLLGWTIRAARVAVPGPAPDPAPTLAPDHRWLRRLS